MKTWFGYRFYKPGALQLRLAALGSGFGWASSQATYEEVVGTLGNIRAWIDDVNKGYAQVVESLRICNSQQQRQLQAAAKEVQKLRGALACKPKERPGSVEFVVSGAKADSLAALWAQIPEGGGSAADVKFWRAAEAAGVPDAAGNRYKVFTRGATLVFMTPRPESIKEVHYL